MDSLRNPSGLLKMCFSLALLSSFCISTKAGQFVFGDMASFHAQHCPCAQCAEKVDAVLRAQVLKELEKAYEIIIIIIIIIYT